MAGMKGGSEGEEERRIDLKERLKERGAEGLKQGR
jgi:hypothetical protein